MGRRLDGPARFRLSGDRSLRRIAEPGGSRRDPGPGGWNPWLRGGGGTVRPGSGFEGYPHGFADPHDSAGGGDRGVFGVDRLLETDRIMSNHRDVPSGFRQRYGADAPGYLRDGGDDNRDDDHRLGERPGGGPGCCLMESRRCSKRNEQTPRPETVGGSFFYPWRHGSRC